LQVFNSIFDFYNALIAWDALPEQTAARTRFFRAYQESRFLFRKESGIEDLLKDLNDKGLKVIGFKEHSQQISIDRELFLTKFRETQDILLQDFELGLARIMHQVACFCVRVDQARTGPSGGIGVRQLAVQHVCG
jgi:hypothetical protein